MIGVALDLLTLRLRYCIDGRPLDDMAKTLPAGKAWIPTVVITEAELEVILNPFCVSCDPDFSSGLVPRAVKELHEDGQSGGQRTFPAGLCEPLAALQSAFLASLLQEYLVVVDVPPAETEGGDAVAEALKASRLLLLTDVTGVLDANMELIQRITPSSADALVKEGIIKGGMIPKLQTAVQAVNNGCGGAAIVDGRIDHAVLEELFSDEGAGTLVVADDEDEE